MNVSECMTKGVQLCSPDDTVKDAARLMRDADVGILPVGEDDRLVGMISDRDIVIRAAWPTAGARPPGPPGDEPRAPLLLLR